MLNSTSTHPVDLTSQGSEYIRSAPRTRDVAATSATTPPQGGLVANFYARPYPTADELSMSGIDDTELQGIVGELRSEVEAVKEETVMLSYNVELLRARRAGGPGAAPAAAAHSTTNASGTGEVTSGVGHTMTNFFSNTNDMTQGEDLAAIGETPMQTNLGASFSSISSGLGNTQSGRRGKGFRRRSNEAVDLCVSVEDKMTMLAKEGDRIRQQEEKTNREAESIRGLLGATVEEAVRRMKELRLEVQQFQREVVDEESGTASADELVRYMSRRKAAQDSYLDKLVGQCQAAETDIVRAQQELRQRRAAGEAFHAIDFEQLRIENQQFNERIDKKNAELVELKGTSTRTVQTLNALMDALNDMTNEQGQLKKEYKSRCDYLARCSKEVVSVTKGAEGAERKNAAIKAQHEAVKVPKIEEYIAQKAELYELEKAAKNWMRKVEIAEGQVKVMRQQTRSLTRQRNAAKAYAESKKQKLAENRTNANLPAVHGGFGGIAARPPVPKLGAPPKASGLPPLAKPPTKRSADPSTNSAVPGASDTTPSSPQQKPPSPLAPTEGAAASVNPDESVNVATEGDGNELVSVTDQVPEVQVEDMDVAAEDESPA